MNLSVVVTHKRTISAVIFQVLEFLKPLNQLDISSSTCQCLTPGVSTSLSSLTSAKSLSYTVDSATIPAPFLHDNGCLYWSSLFCNMSTSEPPTPTTGLSMDSDICPVCRVQYLTKPKPSTGFHSPENANRMYQQVCHAIMQRC